MIHDTPTVAGSAKESMREQDPRHSTMAGSSRLRLPFSPWHLVLIPLSFLLLVPLLWMLVTSLQTTSEANRFPPTLPAHPRWANYPDAWASAPFGHFFLNSTLVTLTVLVSNLVICSLAGYAFARIRFLGRGLMFVTLMATLMVPFQVTMIPVFLIVKSVSYTHLTLPTNREV